MKRLKERLLSAPSIVTSTLVVGFLAIKTGVKMDLEIQEATTEADRISRETAQAVITELESHQTAQNPRPCIGANHVESSLGLIIDEAGDTQGLSFSTIHPYQDETVEVDVLDSPPYNAEPGPEDQILFRFPQRTQGANPLHPNTKPSSRSQMWQLYLDFRQKIFEASQEDDIEPERPLDPDLMA